MYNQIKKNKEIIYYDKIVKDPNRSALVVVFKLFKWMFRSRMFRVACDNEVTRGRLVPHTH